MPCRILCVLLFVAWTGEAPLDRDPVLYMGLWRSPFQFFGPLFVSIPGLNLFPLQVMLLAAIALCFVNPGAFRKRSGLLDLAILISLLSIGLTFVWGVARGGSAYQAYYQLWRFLTALALGLALQSAIRRPRDLKALGYTVLLAALVRATLVMYFYWTVVRGKIDPLPPSFFMTNHEDTILFVAGVVISLSWAVVRGRLLTWMAALFVIPYIFYAVVLNNRRLAWIELLFALCLMFVLLPRPLRRRLTWCLPIIAPMVIVYLAVGWGRDGGIWAPAHALATAGSNQDSSSLARQEEIRNLLYTLSTAGNPLLGTGWGVPYKQVSSVYTHFGKQFWQYPYLPHNSLLGVAAFSGLLGVGGAWLVVPMTAFLGMLGHRGAVQDATRAAAMTVICVLPAFGVQCYGDIGFQSFTGCLVLGVAMGIAGKVAAWDEASAARPAPSRALTDVMSPAGA